MRASPTSILGAVGALSIGLALLTGCGPTGAESEVVTPEVLAVNPELATLPDISVVADIPYGDDPAQQLVACLPHREEPSSADTVGAADPADPT